MIVDTVSVAGGKGHHGPPAGGSDGIVSG